MDTVAETPQQNKPAFFYIKRTISAILLVLLAAVFVYSGYSKMYSNNAFDNFQWTFIDLGISSQLLAGIVARVMIGLEFTLALFLLFHIFLKQFTYKAIIAILTIFIVYLLFVIMKQGNTGNCGCFGDKLAMKPVDAIIKNVVMIAVTILLMYIYPIKPFKNQDVFSIPIVGLGFAIPFVLNAIDLSNAPVRISNKKTIDMAQLYKATPAPEVDLRTGKHFIAYMSLTCSHCKKAAYLLQIIHREHPELPIYLVLSGHPDQEKAFFDETHAQGVPHVFYRDTEDFTKMAGMDGLPAIYWVNNGVAEFKSERTYYQLDPKYMIEWVKKK
jgi:uncharacterized membrane protein YphA (DoxX/SURF4 family)